MDQEFIVAAYETKDMGHIYIKLTINTRGLPKSQIVRYSIEESIR